MEEGSVSSGVEGYRDGRKERRVGGVKGGSEGVAGWRSSTYLACLPVTLAHSRHSELTLIKVSPPPRRRRPGQTRF